jgi:hypothetical protein
VDARASVRQNANDREPTKIAPRPRCTGVLIRQRSAEQQCPAPARQMPSVTTAHSPVGDGIGRVSGLLAPYCRRSWVRAAWNGRRRRLYYYTRARGGL